MAIDANVEAGDRAKQELSIVCTTMESMSYTWFTIFKWLGAFHGLRLNSLEELLSNEQLIVWLVASLIKRD
jgi:hypothetical protein